MELKTGENCSTTGYNQSMDFNIAEIIQRVVTFMPAFLLALVVHEYAHAWMAYRWGDQTSEWSGRLTLNPVAHMDPFGTIAFPLLSIVMGSSIFFGWAKPVPIDPSRFRNYRKGLFWVSFAGPLSNILLGFFTAFALVGFRILVPQGVGLREFGDASLQGLLLINFALAIFNLIPIPPLDGSNIVMSFLNHSAARKFAEFQQYSFFLLLFLMFSGALRVIGVPIMYLANFSMSLAATVFGFALGY
jgi:Zn-dependent protease